MKTEQEVKHRICEWCGVDRDADQKKIKALVHALEKALPWIDKRALPEIGEEKQAIQQAGE